MYNIQFLSGAPDRRLAGSAIIAIIFCVLLGYRSFETIC